MSEIQAQETQAQQRTVVGKVISDKMDKTIVVEVVRNVRHPMYGKYLRRSTRLYAHDETNQCKIGDEVLIKQSRPISKTKHWQLVEVVKEAKEQ